MGWKVCHFGRVGATWEAGSLDDAEAGKRDGCEAGCYKCLLSYYNQTEHGCSTGTTERCSSSSAG